MPFVRGFLGRWHPGHRPDIGLPGPEGEVDPGWGIEEGGEVAPPWVGGGRPGHPIYPVLPPREDWPELPPWLQPGVGLPIPPTIEHPWVPALPDEGVDPPEIWPPLPLPPTMPDLSGKTLILATFHVSRHVHWTRWVVVDHAEAKGKIEKAIAWLKSHLPAGGVGGRPPQRPTPGG